MGRYSFSGHESFFCKPLWLKKAYDAMNEGVNFSSPDAVAALGVGKNMVASIRFWSRAFGLSTNDIPTPFAVSIFDTDKGYDPYLEDEGTLWLLHYYLLITILSSDGYLLYLVVELNVQYSLVFLLFHDLCFSKSSIFKATGLRTNFIT